MDNTNANQSPNQGLIAVGWCCAVLMPLIGLITGAILTGKNEIGHGVGQMIVSLGCFMIWMVIFASA